MAINFQRQKGSRSEGTGVSAFRRPDPIEPEDSRAFRDIAIGDPHGMGRSAFDLDDIAVISTLVQQSPHALFVTEIHNHRRFHETSLGRDLDEISRQFVPLDHESWSLSFSLALFRSEYHATPRT